MSPEELLTLFREEMDDEVEPYLWSDTFFYGALDDAQKMFCRWTEGIADASTPVVTTLEVEEGTTWLDLDPTLLRIRTATKSDGCDLEIVNHEDLLKRGWRFNGVPGAIRALVIGLEANRARVYPDASLADTISLSVFRLPLDAIEDRNDELEIDEQHHRHLLLWGKSLAYGVQDAETYDKTKKAEFRVEFRSYCDQAKAEQGRAKHKTRIVAYGGL